MFLLDIQGRIQSFAASKPFSRFLCGVHRKISFPPIGGLEPGGLVLLAGWFPICPAEVQSPKPSWGSPERKQQGMVYEGHSISHFLPIVPIEKKNTHNKNGKPPSSPSSSGPHLSTALFPGVPKKGENAKKLRPKNPQEGRSPPAAREAAEATEVLVTSLRQLPSLDVPPTVGRIAVVFPSYTQGL